MKKLIILLLLALLILPLLAGATRLRRLPRSGSKDDGSGQPLP